MSDTQVVAINGPRQSGKTTLAKTIVASGWRYLTFDDQTVLEAANSNPVGFVRDRDKAVIDDDTTRPRPHARFETVDRRGSPTGPLPDHRVRPHFDHGLANQIPGVSSQGCRCSRFQFLQSVRGRRDVRLDGSRESGILRP
jgi:hypothetical protein